MAAASAAPLLQGADHPKRITIAMGSAGERVFKLGDQEVVLMGGNYVIKGPPYFPPKEVVSADALEMSQGAEQMLYKPPPAADGSARCVKPCVRLGCLWGGSMPDKAGPIDPTWAANLETTIKAFAEQNVYVFLELHDDAFTTTNGGEGLPWWTGAYMQETAHAHSTSGHCCCFTKPSYITPVTTWKSWVEDCSRKGRGGHPPPGSACAHVGLPPPMDEETRERVRAANSWSKLGRGPSVWDRDDDWWPEDEQDDLHLGPQSMETEVYFMATHVAWPVEADAEDQGTRVLEILQALAPEALRHRFQGGSAEDLVPGLLRRNPENPMTTVCPWWVCCCCKIEPVRSHGDNPWAAYAVGTNQGNPASMNVGNRSMRMNNNDLSWGLGTLVWTTQVHNYAPRLYQCHSNAADRQALFEPYVQYIQWLCRKWEQHWNVIGIELLNEPVLGGMPNLKRFLSCRRDLFDFYANVMDSLGKSDPPIRAPLALEDGFGSLGSGSNFMKVLSMIPISSFAKEKLKEWGEKNQLILSIHWYPSGGTLGHLAKVTVEQYVAMGKKESAELMASSPIWVSEFCMLLPEHTAKYLAEFTNAGSPCTTYWQYTDTQYTQSFGWYKYPPEVKQYGDPVDVLGIVNEKAWAAYEPTVADGTYWGAQITGSGGGQTGVLSKVK